PGFGSLGNFLVQVGLPQRLAVDGEFEHRAIRPGREELVALGRKTNQGWAADLWSFYPVAAKKTAVPEAGDDGSLAVGGDVGKSCSIGHRAGLPIRKRESVERVGMLIRGKGRLAGETATFPVACPDIESFPVGGKARRAPEGRPEALDRETLDGF